MKLFSLIYVVLRLSSGEITLASAACKENDDAKFYPGGVQLSGEEDVIQDCAWLQSTIPFLQHVICDNTESFTDPNNIDIVYPPASVVCYETCDSCPSYKQSSLISSNDSPQECVEDGSDHFFLGFDNDGSPLPLATCADLAELSYIPNAVQVICSRTESFMDQNSRTVSPPANEICLVTCDRCPEEDDARIPMGSAPEDPMLETKDPISIPSSVPTEKGPNEQIDILRTISPSSRPTTESFYTRSPTNSPNSYKQHPTASNKSLSSRPSDLQSIALSSSPSNAPTKKPTSIPSYHPSMVSNASLFSSPTNATNNSSPITPTSTPSYVSPTYIPYDIATEENISSRNDSSNAPSFRPSNTEDNTPSFIPSHELHEFHMTTPSSVRLRVKKRGKVEKSARARKVSKSAKDTKARGEPGVKRKEKKRRPAL